MALGGADFFGFEGKICVPRQAREPGLRNLWTIFKIIGHTNHLPPDKTKPYFRPLIMNRLKKAAHPVRWRTIALPAEHGSWGFMAEPLLAGLLVAPSTAGGFLAVGLFGLFLLRWPVKVMLQASRQRRRSRAQAAAWFAAAYGSIAAGGLGGAIGLGGWGPLWPLGLALPLMAIFLVFDWTNRSRAWPAEVAAAAAFASGAAAIALAGRMPAGPAFGLWVVVAARAVPAVLFVRARLRLDKGQAARVMPALAVHLVSLAVVGSLALSIPSFWPAAGMLLLLFGRAVVGLSRWRRPVAVKWIGIAEIGWGLLVVASLFFGFVYLRG